MTLFAGDDLLTAMSDLGAVEAVASGTTVSGIFQSPADTIPIFGANVTMSNPTLLVRTTDAVDRNETLTIQGTDYRVYDVLALDDAELTLLELHRE